MAPQPWRLLVLFLVLAGCIAVLAWWAYVTEAESLRERQYEQLAAIAEFKEAEINAWLAERRGDAKAVIASRFTREDFGRWLETHDAKLESRLRERLEALRVYDSYVAAEWLDRQGSPRIVAGFAGQALPEEAPLGLAGMGAGEPQLVDLHRDRRSGAIRLAYVLPIPGAGKEEAARLGYLRLTIDPRKHLYPLMQSWPTPSPSAETLIVRREGNDALFLNDVRHLGNTALEFRVPLAGSGDFVAARAAGGSEGIFEGTDYRGAKVLSYLRPIPGTPWTMVAKVDRSEVFQDIDQVARVTFAVTIVLLALGGQVLWMWWRRQQVSAQLGLQQELERIAEVSPGVIHSFLLRPDGSSAFPYASPAIQEVLGFPPELLAEDAAPFIAHAHPDDFRRLKGLVTDSARDLSSWQAEFRYIHPSKGEIWVEEKSVPTRQPDGSVIWHGFLSDVTERKQAERVLAATQERYRSLFDNMLNGYFRGRLRYEGGAPADFICLDVNPAFAGLTGLRDIVGKWASEAMPGIRESNPELLEAFDRVIRLRQPERLETYMPFLDRWFAIALFSTEPEHFVAVFDDVTERKRAQLALESHRAQLEATVAARTAELVAANHQLQAFTYAVSHDLKAPLRGISSFAALLKRNYLDRLEGEGSLYLEHIGKSAARMGAIIDDLLAYSHMEQHALHFQDIDLPEALHAVLAERQQEIRLCGAEVRIDLPAMKIRADRQGLAQVLRNLLENALKYSAKTPHPVIEIGGEPQSGHCRLWIRDNGIGFDMAYHDRIFELFRRLHGAGEYQGTGVGLALVRKAMGRMGGRVWAESAPGQGAVFFLEFQAAG